MPRQPDLHPVIERVWEAESLCLREAGFSADWVADPGPYPAHCDTDAIAQVLVNLISNAEKYSPDHHGDLTCHPREGGGSIFTLQIPTTND